jgi:putative phage-type endonuclease
VTVYTVGGSEAAAACGVDPYRSRVNLWARKRGLIPEPPQTEAALWGILLQPVVLSVLGNAHGFEVEEADAEFRDPERPWMVGHPDAFGHKDGASYVIDAKTTGGWNANQWGEDDAPTAYICQIQHYLHLTGLERGLLACLLGGQRLVLRTVHRDEKTIALILTLEEEFVEMCQSGEWPEPVGSTSDTETLRAMFPAGNPGKTVTLDPGALAALAEYRKVERVYQRVKVQRDELVQRLKIAIGDAEVAETPAGEIAARWTTYTRLGEVKRRFTITGNGGE